jgi:hypothetical protein
MKDGNESERKKKIGDNLFINIWGFNKDVRKD